MTYYVAGTMEAVDDAEEYLKKEEAHCRAGNDFLKKWWEEQKKNRKDVVEGHVVFDFEDSLKNYLDGLREDIRNNATFSIDPDLNKS